MDPRRLVVAYDGSESAEGALSWGLEEAKLRDIPVLVLMSGYGSSVGLRGYGTYVEPPPSEFRSFSEEVLAQASRRAALSHPEVEVSTRFVEGNPAPTILGVLRDLGPGTEAVVLGSRGIGGFTELMLGSTSLQVAAHAPCPAVVVRPRTEAEPTSGTGLPVVVGVDGSELSSDAIQYAFEAAARRGVPLVAVHAWTAPFFELPGHGGPVPESTVEDAFAEQERTALAEAMAGWREKFPDVVVEEQLAHGDPVEVLVRASADAQLVCVGTRGRGGFRSLVLGSVSHGLLHHARCTVVVVRPTS